MTLKISIPKENYCEYCGEHLSSHKEQECKSLFRGKKSFQTQATAIRRPQRSPIEVPHLFSIRSMIKEKKVVEPGSAAGDLCRGFSLYANEVSGIEKKDFWIKKAKRMQKNSGKNIRYTTADIYDIFTPPKNKSQITDFANRAVGDLYYFWAIPQSFIDFCTVLNDLMNNPSLKNIFPAEVKIITPLFIDYDCNLWAEKKSYKQELKKFGRLKYENFDDIIYFKTMEDNFDESKSGRADLSNSLRKHRLTQLGILCLPTSKERIESLITRDPVPKAEESTELNYIVISPEK